MKKWTAMLLTLVMLASALVGCAPAATAPAAEAADSAGSSNRGPGYTSAGKDVNLSFFTEKVETIDLLDQIIADYRAVQWHHRRAGVPAGREQHHQDQVRFRRGAGCHGDL